MDDVTIILKALTDHHVTYNNFMGHVCRCGWTSGADVQGTPKTEFRQHQAEQIAAALAAEKPTSEDDPDDANGYSRSDLLFGGNW